MMEKVLVIGSGGREHALGWSIAKSDEVSQVIYAPGNGGTEGGKGRNVPVAADDFAGIASLIDTDRIGLCVIGPDQPLADGLTDYLQERGHAVFGPSKLAACIESDKFFSYDVMAAAKVTQATSIKCVSLEDAIDAIHELSTQAGIVLKARGLTLGKGVLVCDSKKEALGSVENHMRDYGSDILVAERLSGPEFSIFGISDGARIEPLMFAVQDHKRLLENDLGPNTGGMGAYCPAQLAHQEIRYVADAILTPVVQQMKEMLREFKGFLYAGIMVTADGMKVLEFNCRFGDPECQPAMMLLDGSIYGSIRDSLDGRSGKISFKQGAAVSVVLASKGYPGKYPVGLPITGIDDLPGVQVFHASTRMKDGELVTAGGRVLGVTAYSPLGLAEARRIAYEAADTITVPGGFHYRRDIGNKGLVRNETI